MEMYVLTFSPSQCISRHYLQNHLVHHLHDAMTVSYLHQQVSQGRLGHFEECGMSQRTHYPHWPTLSRVQSSRLQISLLHFVTCLRVRVSAVRL